MKLRELQLNSKPRRKRKRRRRSKICRILSMKNYLSKLSSRNSCRSSSGSRGRGKKLISPHSS
jgi:hypothetical protein